MKRIINYIIVGFLAILFVTSCKKDENRIFIEPAASFNLVSNYSTPLTLMQANQADTVLKFTRDSASFGFNAAITYTLQIAKVGNAFTSANTATTDFTSAKNIYYTVKDINKALIVISAIGVETEYQARVLASVADSADPVYSNIVKFKATPYKDFITYLYPQALWIAGNFQGWSPSSAPKIVDPKATAGGGDNYEGYINFTDASPLFKMVKGDNWGAGDFGDAAGNGQSGVLKPNTAGNNNINLTQGASVYLLRANTVALTWNAIKIDMWGIIGDATPGSWTTPTAMTYDATTNTYSITTNLTAGKIKFRANNNWDINFGDDNLDGKPDYGGANIDVAVAGNYTITLDLTAGNYSYLIKKN